jgi:molecular chaperone DnaK (HSP70)
VGFSPAGDLLVGEAARNQQALYPERTVRSIKRKMGSEEKVRVGKKDFLPQEISALILRELAEWAHRALGERPEKAVITVPAYFSDAQRNATREAGALAGLEVVRILNEPTAASLAYGYGDGSRHTALIYDLGGGTFDVSVVIVEGDITEVLASHGNNRLAGGAPDGGVRKAARRGCPRGTAGGQGAALVGGGRSQEEAELRTVRQDPRGGAGLQALPALASRSRDFARRI